VVGARPVSARWRPTRPRRAPAAPGRCPPGCGTGANASGFQLYTALTDSDKQKLAAAVKAVQEPLSQVAGKVANS